MKGKFSESDLYCKKQNIQAKDNSKEKQFC